MTQAFPKPQKPGVRKLNRHAQAYKDWLAAKGCLVCGKRASLHHVHGARSWKTRKPLPRRKAAADLCLVPLCRGHHTDGWDSIHQLGEDAFGMTHLGGSDACIAWAMTFLAMYVSEGRA